MSSRYRKLVSSKGSDKLKARAKPVLLWIWKNVPFPAWARLAYLDLTHPRFLVGVMALIQDEQGRVLTLEHTYRRRYAWGLPGGYVKRREAPYEGLLREVCEETSLRVEIEALLGAELYSPFQLDLLYRCRVVSGEFQPSSEVRAFRYEPVDSLGHILPNQVKMLRLAGIIPA
jgi:8-oxo-dGTP pyrophosphatase MutT (NUDIX family)